MKYIADLLASGLGLSPPWSVTGIEPRAKRNGKLEVVVRLGHSQDALFKGSDGRRRKVHGTVKRTWAHLPPFGDRCVLYARVPRLREGSGVHMVSVPWARRGSGLTLALERHCLELLREGATIERVSRQMGIYPQRLWGLLHHWVPKLHGTRLLQGPATLAIVGIPLGDRDGHLTLIVDLQRGRVLQTLGGGPSGTANRAISLLEGEGRDRDAIAYVLTGPSARDIESCRQHFPRAKVAVNRHHVVELVQGALEDAQRMAHGDGRVDELPELFGGLWEMADAQAAAGCLAYCCDRARESGLAPLVALADTVRECWEAITGLWDVGIPHNTLEHLHREVASIVRSGRGYRDLHHLCLMVLLRLGGLALDEVAPR